VSASRLGGGPHGFWAVWLPLSAVLYLSVPVVGAAMIRAEVRNPVGGSWR
jgi:hypothetical protein